MALQLLGCGLACIKRDGYNTHRWEEYSVAQDPGKAARPGIDYLEGMAVQMHRVAHHQHVVEHDLDPLAGFRGGRLVGCPGLAVDRPDIGLHGARQHQHRGVGSRSCSQRVGRAQKEILAKVSVEDGRACLRQCGQTRHFRARCGEDQSGLFPCAFALGEDREGPGPRKVCFDVQSLIHRRTEARGYDGLNIVAVDRNQACYGVGLAVGTVTDMAIEIADVVLMGGDLGGVENAFCISCATMRNIEQNLSWAFAYNVALIPVAAGMLYPVNGTLLWPMLAAGAMAMYSVFVLTNALRLKRFASTARAK